VDDDPFEQLIGGDVDTVSFVRDHVELRISLDPADRVGAEAAHLVPADSSGRLDVTLALAHLA